MLRFSNFFNLLFFLVVFATAYAQETNKISIDLSNDIVSPKSYVVHRSTNPIHIDGKAEEKDWQNAMYTTSFIDIEGIKTPKYDTKLKMLWDDTYLYIYAKLEEEHIWGTLKNRDTIIFYNNDFEIFIDPSNDTHNYGEIEINALGTVWDLLLDKPYRSGSKPNFHWNLNNLKTAIHIEGTLNNASDIDSFWAVEMAIPLKAFIELKDLPRIAPKNGEQWRINFSRVNWDFDLIENKYYRKKVNNKYLPEYNWVWSNQKVINMHEPEKWGYIQFSTQSADKPDLFEQKDDVLLRQLAYALYRRISRGKLKTLLENNPGSIIEITPILNKKSSNYKASFLKTYSGFNLVVENTKTEITHIIREDGYLKILK